jgi:hypothetical protein
VDEGRGDENPGSDRGDGRDLPARFDEGFEPDENEPFFDPAELTPQQNIARDLLYKLTVYGGNLTPRAEIVANFLATLAEQSGPDRAARARRLAAMAAAAVQDLPAVVERLLGQFLNNGAVVEEEIGKPGLEDKAARVMATVQALVNEHNEVKAATERRGDPQDIVKAAEKLVPAAKEAQKRIADFVATGFSRLGDAAERDARAKARIDLARRTVYGNQDLGFLVVVSAIAEWFMRRSRVKELREKWSREERAAADAEGTDDDAGHDDDGPPDGDGDGDTDGDRGPKGGRR